MGCPPGLDEERFRLLVKILRDGKLRASGIPGIGEDSLVLLSVTGNKSRSAASCCLRPIRSGKELARWKPKMQKVLIQISPSVHPIVPLAQPYRFDISPDGEYIVEGGAGVVILFKIES